MSWTPSALIFFTMWVSGVSVCIGIVIGMGLMIWHQRKTREPVTVIPQPASEELPSREEIQMLLKTLLETNAKVDARVELHSVRIEEITETFESGKETLVCAARLLVAANRQLQGDLATTKSELEHQRELVDSFKRESRTDALTELLNRRAFESEINESLVTHRQKGLEFSLLLIDIDHFKRINDEHGHLKGDQVLSTVAQCLKSNIRDPASISRYGGEEFAVILPGVDGESAMEIAESLRWNVENISFCIEGQATTVTISVGVAEAQSNDSRSHLVERADQALLEAKASGRNRCLFGETYNQNVSNLCATCS